MVYIGRNIAYFFKPFVEECRRLTIICFTADLPVFLKWAKKLEWFELFAQKSRVVFRRADVFYKINKLHAKVFIFDDRIFLSSANLTYGSLYVNVEHAVEVTDEGERIKILKYLEKMRDDKKK